MKNGILAIPVWYDNKKRKGKKQGRAYTFRFTFVRLFYGDIKILLKNDGKRGIVAKRKEMGKTGLRKTN